MTLMNDFPTVNWSVDQDLDGKIYSVEQFLKISIWNVYVL